MARIFLALLAAFSAVCVAAPLTKAQVLQQLGEPVYILYASNEPEGERKYTYAYLTMEQFRPAILEAANLSEDPDIVKALIGWAKRSFEMSLHAASENQKLLEKLVSDVGTAHARYLARSRNGSALEREQFKITSELLSFVSVILSLSPALSPADEDEILNLSQRSMGLAIVAILKRRYATPKRGLTIVEASRAIEPTRRISRYNENYLAELVTDRLSFENRSAKLSDEEIEIAANEIDAWQPDKSSVWTRVWFRALRFDSRLLQQIDLDKFILKLAEALPKDERIVHSVTGRSLNPEITLYLDVVWGIVGPHIERRIIANDPNAYNIVMNTMLATMDKPYVVGFMVRNVLERFVNDPKCQAFIIALASDKLNNSLTAAGHYLHILTKKAHRIFPENQKALNALHAKLQGNFDFWEGTNLGYNESVALSAVSDFGSALYFNCFRHLLDVRSAMSAVARNYTRPTEY